MYSAGDGGSCAGLDAVPHPSRWVTSWFENHWTYTSAPVSAVGCNFLTRTLSRGLVFCSGSSRICSYSGIKISEVDESFGRRIYYIVIELSRNRCFKTFTTSPDFADEGRSFHVFLLSEQLARISSYSEKNTTILRAEEGLQYSSYCAQFRVCCAQHLRWDGVGE